MRGRDPVERGLGSKVKRAGGGLRRWQEDEETNRKEANIAKCLICCDAGMVETADGQRRRQIVKELKSVNVFMYFI